MFNKAGITYTFLKNKMTDYSNNEQTQEIFNYE